MRRQRIQGNHIVTADENIELTGKFTLWKVQVYVSRKHVAVWNNVMIGEHERTAAESGSSETRGSRADKNTLAEMLECSVHWSGLAS